MRTETRRAIVAGEVMTDPPRVTGVVRHFGLDADLSGIDPEVLERARERGTLVHAAIEDEVYGTLDEAALRPDIAEYLAGYRRFAAETGFRPVVAEYEVEHRTWHYQGRLDLVGWLGHHRVLPDIKTAYDPDLWAASIQTTAYERAWESDHPMEPISRRLVIRIRPGAYRLYDLEEEAKRGVCPSSSEAWQIFQACLVVLAAQRRRNGHGG